MKRQGSGAQGDDRGRQPNRINRLLAAAIARKYKSLTNLVMVRNVGLNCEESGGMRAALGERGIVMQVVRNRVSVRAFREMGVEEAAKLFDGPTAIIEGDDPVIAAKAAAEFCKKFEGKLEIVAGLVEGKVLGREQVLELARAKSRPQLLAEIAGTLKAPGENLSAQFQGPGSRIAGAIKALVEKLETEAGEGNAAA